MESRYNANFDPDVAENYHVRGKPVARGDSMFQKQSLTDPQFNQHEDPRLVALSLEEMEKRLFGISRPNFQQQEITDADFIPVKTGIGVKLMKNGPKHIMDAEDLEPLYIPQEHILEECLRREAERVAHQENLMNRVVYDSVDSAPKHFMGGELPDNDKQDEAFKGEDQPLNDDQKKTDENTALNSDACDNDQVMSPYYQPSFKNDHTLVFESRFESGNLRRAIQVYEFEYDLILKPDYNTNRHTQWYYFRVSNTVAGRTYRFNIINLLKPDSLYNHGMRPLMYSEIDAKKYGKGWVRAGRDVCYYQNSMKRKSLGHYYTLTFRVQFNNENDTVYFAHSYPYTYSDLARYLNTLEADPKKKLRFRRKTLCQSCAGNNVDMLIITTFGCEYEEVRKRKGVIISSRVHPGETGSSFMLKGIIDYLLGPCLGARMLRDNFVFKIVPMLNPDGVINGHTRCNNAGVDLNRIWIEPTQKQHPTIFAIKNLIRQMQQERELFLYCDLHGHSRKKNMFMYGNSGKNETQTKEKIFPFLLEKAADVFNFLDCSFAVQKSKESTARVVGWKEMGIQNCYTLESSFCGSDFGKYQDLHFNTNMLQSIGPKFCETILEVCQLEQNRIKQIFDEIEAVETSKAQSGAQTGPANGDKGITGTGMDDETAAGGLLSVDGNIGVLGVIKDEDSCQDSDFSGDEGGNQGVDATAKEVIEKPITAQIQQQAKIVKVEKQVDRHASTRDVVGGKKEEGKGTQKEGKKQQDNAKPVLKLKPKKTVKNTTSN